MDVIELPFANLMELAGLPWADAKAKAPLVSGEVFTVPQWGWTFKQKNAESPVTDVNGSRLLKIDHVWLREVDKRAFLYLQY